jgi:hypothetical protein
MEKEVQFGLAHKAALDARRAKLTAADRFIIMTTKGLKILETSSPTHRLYQLHLSMTQWRRGNSLDKPGFGV